MVAAGYIPFADPHKLYCICRKPETLDMIGCDSCDEWFHASCFDINLAAIEDIANFPFQCPDCQKAAAQPAEQHKQESTLSERSLSKKRQIKEKTKMGTLPPKSSAPPSPSDP